MMDIKVKSLYLKLSPTKMRPVLFGARGKNVNEARTFLTFTNKKGAKMILSLLKSALAIAKENDLEADNMYVKTIYCNEGPRLGRRKARSKGMAYPITKRMCHLTLVIGQGEEAKEETVKEESTKSEKKLDKPETKEVKKEKTKSEGQNSKTVKK